jgi:peptidoglycan glycosyltransferase/penicillin-binding protein 2
MFLLMSLFLTLFLGLLGRIFYYQIIRGEEITRAAVAMRSQQIGLNEYNRGDILDRNLSPLTNTRTTTALYCLPELVEKEANVNGSMVEDQAGKDMLWQDLAKFLAQVLKNRDEQEILAEIKNAYTGNQFTRIDGGVSNSA